MEKRKEKEIEHYDEKAKILLNGEFNPAEFKQMLALDSFKFFFGLLAKCSPNKVVLDYGCGFGSYSAFPLRAGASKVVAIDLSEQSLGLAKKRAEKEISGGKIEFLKADCEDTNFPDDYFDVIFDVGTFSSLDISKVLPELARILKKDGMVLGIETFGHNPFTNFKRKINNTFGRRTDWAVSHILQSKDLEAAQKYFESVQVYFFHQVSWLAFPLLRAPGGKFFLNFLQFFDKLTNKISFFQKNSFKVVFVFTHPKNVKTLI
jgi:SAM-dependent methyltransferase